MMDGHKFPHILLLPGTQSEWISAGFPPKSPGCQSVAMVGTLSQCHKASKLKAGILRIYHTYMGPYNQRVYGYPGGEAKG